MLEFCVFGATRATSWLNSMREQVRVSATSRKRAFCTEC